MISKEVATTQLARLMGLSYYPRDNRMAEEDLVLALKAAYNDAIVVDVVNDWVAEQNICPKPADLRAMIWERNEKIKKAPVPYEKPFRGLSCNVCKGYGIVESTHADDLLSVARYCECAAGRQKEETSCKCEDFCGRQLPDLGDQKEENLCCYPPWRINQARFKLLKKFGNKPLKQMINEALK